MGLLANVSLCRIEISSLPVTYALSSTNIKTRLIYRKSSNKPPGGLFANMNFWWGLIRGEGLFKGGFFQTLAFSSKVDIKNGIISHSATLKMYKKVILLTKVISQ